MKYPSLTNWTATKTVFVTCKGTYYMMMGIFNRVKDMPVYVFGHTQILTYQKTKLVLLLLPWMYFNLDMLLLYMILLVYNDVAFLICTKFSLCRPVFPFVKTFNLTKVLLTMHMLYYCLHKWMSNPLIQKYKRQSCSHHLTFWLHEKNNK